MYSKYLSKLSALPARTADWAGRHGPVSLWGVDTLMNGSAKRLHETFQETALHSDSDWYHTVKWFEEGPLEAPPVNVPHLPVLNCGIMTPDEIPEGGDATKTPATNFEWYNATIQASATFVEKGYIPVTLGGGPDVTLPIIEGIRRTINEDIILMNYGADTRISTPTSPVRVLLQKNDLKGYIHIGGRGINKASRKARKEYNCRYMDSNGIFQKGTHMIKDLKNSYPMYLTIDLGVLDPVFAPGVAHPEPGGFSTRELLHLMSVTRGTRIVGIDIVGYSPEFDMKVGQHPFGLTELAAGKIIKEAILRAYITSTLSSEEGHQRIQEMKKAGTAPTTYPDI